jgi:hypothetical protein
MWMNNQPDTSTPRTRGLSARSGSCRPGVVKVSIATKLFLNFLPGILLAGVTFNLVDVRVIGNRVGDDVQARGQADLPALREMQNL